MSLNENVSSNALKSFLLSSPDLEEEVCLHGGCPKNIYVLGNSYLDFFEIMRLGGGGVNTYKCAY